MGFITVDDVKNALGIPLSSTKEDDKITSAVNRANAEILAYLCLDQCDPKDYALSVDIDCYDRHIDSLGFQPRPVIAIVDDTVFNGTRQISSEHYRIRHGHLRILCDYWCCGCPCGDGTPSVRATVTAGFDQTDPLQLNQFLAIQGGVLDYAISIYRGAAGSGLKSEQIGRYRYERFAGGESGLNGYAHWPDTLSAALTYLYCPETGYQLSR